ncbi:SpoIIE family protein phosphatase [Actinotalea sp. BY-33]|uniref:SpoIIE family protein phosphatase n=1 Tax=Actinotalea soli TaxID=2819234 RepID=A0A939LQX1_9CELL|nr:SpoIIE family protein phosphatase [Actinotalea soli]MBO1752178.1 SpoIIE family protein phosphatase [Actinotalea soli]
MSDTWLTRATGDTPTGALARSIDWAATPIGHPDTWPTSLRVAVEICFSTRFPVLVTWGTDLIKIYNDAYREILGRDKHPQAMGARVRDIWPEIWPTLEPSFQHVFDTGRPTWHENQLLLMERNGYVEEAYFTYSYSPLWDDDGAVRGVLDIATETTEYVLERRRMRLLADLSETLQHHAGDLAGIGRATADVLRVGRADVAAMDLYLTTGPGQTYLLASTRPADDVAAASMALVRDVAASGRPAEVDHTVVVPLITVGEQTAGVLVLEASARRVFDAGYRAFFDLLASTVGTALSTTLRYVREVGDLRAVSDALQQSILPRGEAVAGLATRYQPATGNLAVGGDWYDVVEVSAGCRALVVGDCVGHGLGAAVVMGQLRTASRTLLLEGNSPEAAVTGLDHFARRLPGAECATVFCGLIDQQAGTLTFSRAGHVPPLLLRDGQARWLREAGSTPLAVTGDERREAVVELQDGDLVVLYTDGLVERRREMLSEGIERLAEAVRPLAGEESVDAIADGLLRALVPSGSEDDVALVVYRHEGSA